MNQGKGTVQKVWANTVGNGKTAYNIVMTDGSKYGHGFNMPQFKEGDTIEFVYNQNGRFTNMDAASVKVVSGEAETSNGAMPSAPKQKGGSGGGREEYWDNKAKADIERQKEIRYQASRNQALELTDMCLREQVIKLPAKQADKLDALLGFIEERTNEFAQQTQDFVEGKTTNNKGVEESTDDYDD